MPRQANATASKDTLAPGESFKVRIVNGEFWTIAEEGEDERDETFSSLKLATDAVKDFLSECRGLALGYTAEDVEIVRVGADNAQIEVLISEDFEEFLITG